MAYEPKNTNTFSGQSKNTNSFSLPELSGQNELLIDSTYFLLIESTFKLLLEPLNQDWVYATKS